MENRQLLKGGDNLKQIKFAKTGYILISILFYLSGILCLIIPDISGKAIAIAGGIILIAYGIIKITGYLSKDLYCLAFQYDLACGIFLLVLGIVVLAVNQRFKGYLLPGVGVLILLDSLLCIQTSMDAKRFGLSSWPVILALSILSGTFGAVLIVTNTQMIAGCSLLAEGVMRHYIVHCTVYLSPDYHPSSPKEDSENAHI